jgi:hypothetical protein
MNSGIHIYDFESTMDSGTLQGNELGNIPLAGPTSGFFVDDTGSIVTTDFSNRAVSWERAAKDKKWQSTELYHGENPLIYAEPSPDGKLLLLLENIGEGNVHGILYSTTARKTWADLGRDYKWLGEAFTEKNNIAVSKHWIWTDVYPILPLSSLVELARREISHECVPSEAGNYRTSPCWPAAFQ